MFRERTLRLVKRQKGDQLAETLRQLGFDQAHWSQDEEDQLHVRWAGRDFLVGPLNYVRPLGTQALGVFIGQAIEFHLIDQQAQLTRLIAEGLDTKQPGRAREALQEISQLFQLPKDPVTLRHICPAP